MCCVVVISFVAVFRVCFLCVASCCHCCVRVCVSICGLCVCCVVVIIFIAVFRLYMVFCAGHIVIICVCVLSSVAFACVAL